MNASVCNDVLLCACACLQRCIYTLYSGRSLPQPSHRGPTFSHDSCRLDVRGTRQRVGEQEEVLTESLWKRKAMPTYSLCHKDAKMETMWTEHTHTHIKSNTAQQAYYCKYPHKHTHPTNHAWSCTLYQRAIRSFSYSYLHVYESQHIPGIQIYLNSDRNSKCPPPESQKRGGGGGQ